MFMVVHCSFFDDPNRIDCWEFEKRIGTFFFTKEEAIEAIKAMSFFAGHSFVKEDVDGIFTADCKDVEVGHWQVVDVSHIKTSDKCIKEWWAF